MKSARNTLEKMIAEGVPLYMTEGARLKQILKHKFSRAEYLRYENWVLVVLESGEVKTCYMPPSDGVSRWKNWPKDCKKED